MKKNSGIFAGLFILMILAFTVDPVLIHNFQDHILGKAVIILILLYLTMNSVTLGLLFALALIIILSRIDIPMIEGFKKNKGKELTSKAKGVLNKSKKLAKNQKNLKNKALKNKALKDKALKDRALKDKALKNIKQKNLAKKITRVAPLSKSLITNAQSNLDEIDGDINIDTQVDDVEMMRNMGFGSDDEYDEYYYPNNYLNTEDYEEDENDEDIGIDRIAVEETFRVRNPSTIPISKEQFRLREIKPFDNVGKYYGGMSSLV